MKHETHGLVSNPPPMKIMSWEEHHNNITVPPLFKKPLKLKAQEIRKLFETHEYRNGKLVAAHPEYKSTGTIGYKKPSHEFYEIVSKDA